jgi:hypothetical protein
MAVVLMAVKNGLKKMDDPRRIGCISLNRKDK